jgi:nitrate reductase NapE
MRAYATCAKRYPARNQRLPTTCGSLHYAHVYIRAKGLGDVASGLLDARRATPLQPIPAPLPPSTRTEELRSFLFFTVVMAPLLAVIGVGGFGFVVWMYQLVAGPPAG